MLLCCLYKILILVSKYCVKNQDSSDKATFFQSSMVQCCWAPVNCKLSFMFLTNNGSSQFSPASVLHLLQGCVCIPWLQWCIIWVTIAFLSDQSSLAIFLRSLVSTRHFCADSCHWLDIFSFTDLLVSANLGDAYIRNPQIFPSSNHPFPQVYLIKIKSLCECVCV